MTMAASFDTLAAARRMEQAGLQREAAEAVASAIRAGQGDLATRADLNGLREATGADLAALEARMYRAMMLQAVAIAGIVIAALKLIP